MFTFAFQPYYLKVLGQNTPSLNLLFFTFGVLGVLMQTQGIKLLTKKLTSSRIMFLGLFFRSICFALMPIIPKIGYFIAVSIVFSIFNSLVQPMISTLISINTKPSEQGMTSGLNAAYLSISNGIGPVIAALLVDRKTIVTAEKIARETGQAVSAHSYTSYSYPLYIAGVCTLAVLFLAIRSQRQYAPPLTEA
jgi:predicted MFS family arabinose efflux permease